MLPKFDCTVVDDYQFSAMDREMPISVVLFREDRFLGKSYTMEGEVHNHPINRITIPNK
ncbi:hypothetical protein PoB_004629600 [Plakobranchus ocellatus]|uniref:Uncharacterized protein n=1 Tax=Plakobranchus ocellatus TaxID=259542 RepID=A0AAV4BH73_9GAST|nr:hypothetical protein PoB_004629600 [Plakobranchus ocellatus]